MASNNTQKGKRSFLRRNWFKLLCASLIIYVFFQKDFSFEINMHAPTVPEDSAPTLSAPEANIKEEALTDGADATGISTGNKKLGNLLEFPKLFGGGKKQSAKVALEKIEEDIKVAYLKRFAHVAISERQKYNIPSSIILANGLLHSVAGKRDIAKGANNHFALICGDGWSGMQGSYDGTCMRKYDNAWSSYRDNSQYLTSGRFAELKKFGTTDYRSWADGLETLKYSKEANLAQTLVELIEYYRLYELDTK